MQVTEKQGDFRQVKLQLTLNDDCLITHLIFKPAPQGFNLVSFEGIDLFDESQNYNKLFQVCEQQQIVGGLGFCRKLRITFITSEQENKLRNKQISIFGYQLYQLPAANQMVTLLKISHVFRGGGKELQLETAEADILFGLSLLSSRRFVQAAEIFKKVAQLYAERFTKKSENYKIRACGLQILVADSINQPSMLMEKLQALKQAVIYFQPQIQLGQFPDAYECVLRLSENLVKIISRVLLKDENFDILKLAHLRCLEFIIEQLGCGLGGQILQIIQLFLVMVDKQQSQQITEMIFKIVNMILSELSQATLQFISDLWCQTIKLEAGIEGQKLIMRICEFLLQADQAHFKINISFLQKLSLLEENKIWNLILTQVVPKLNEKRLSKIIQWINAQLSEHLNLCHYNSLPSVKHNQIMKLLQLIQTIQQVPEQQTYKEFETLIQMKNIYLNGYQNLIILKPILIKLMDQSVNGKVKLDTFKLVWNILIKIQLDNNECEQIYELINPFLIKIFNICQNIFPTQEILVILDHILQSIKYECNFIVQKLEQQLYQYMEIFCSCVPHSIHDETFQIFDMLLNFTILDQQLIEKCVMALIDQYTVKGQAQKCSKQNFIKKILQNQQHLSSLIWVCLIENQEQLLYKDPKQQNQDHEIFMEKLSIICEAFQDLSQHFKTIAQMILKESKFYSAIVELITSQNSKIRQKGNLILQLLVDGYVTLDCSTRLKYFKNQIVFIEFITKVFQKSDLSDSKCLMPTLLMLNNLFGIKFQRSEQEELLIQMQKLWDRLIELLNTPFNSIYSMMFDLLNQWGQLLSKISYNHMFEQIFEWATNELESSDPWHQFNVLKFCGYIFGLDTGKFKQFEGIPSTFFEHTAKLQHSNNKQLQLMAIVIIQLCAPEQISLRIISLEVQQQQQLKHKFNKQKEHINRQSDNLIHQLFNNQQSKDQQSDTYCSTSIDETELSVEHFLWLKKIDTEQLQQCLQALFIFQMQQESIPQSEIKEIILKQSSNNINTNKSILDEDPMDFDELGIIEVDDEEWNEYDDLSKIPILKERIKPISPHIGSRTPLNIKQIQERQPSGNIKQRKEEVELTKTLRPNNQICRPLTPPIGNQQQQQPTNQNLQMISDYMIQNPQQFQKIMEDIKTSKSQTSQQEEQFESTRRRVDELEFDPQFSNSSQDGIIDEEKKTQKSIKAKKKKSSKKPKQKPQQQLYHSLQPTTSKKKLKK